MRNRFISHIEVLYCIALFASCTNKNVKARNNEISKISFASGGCYGKCPFMAIEVDSSLSYKYYGGQYSDKPGFYAGKISTVLWDSINIKFEKVDFKHLDSSYQLSIDDLATQTVIDYGDKRKIITAQSASLPKNIDSVLTWIMYSYKKVNLIPSKDSINFYSRLQYPILLPPPIPKTYKVPKVGR
jgi:hypothetical protein